MRMDQKQDLETLGIALAAIPGLAIREREPLSAHTSMGAGGPARYFVEVDRRDALDPLLELLRSAGVPWMALGGGSNTLFSDEGFEGVIVRPGRDFRGIREGDEPHTIVAGAGANLSAVMNFAKRRGLGGVEFGVGIPGTLGGALAGNAGAGGQDICSITESVGVLTPEGERVVRGRGEFKYAYRKSDLKRDFILEATLRLCPDAPEAIQARIDGHLGKRKEQPVGHRSAGCMFKNPPGSAAGRLIDQTGLKGLRINQIWVSDKHANFMINDGGGSVADILALMNRVRDEVRAATGVELETEVRVVPPAGLPPEPDAQGE